MGLKIKKIDAKARRRLSSLVEGINGGIYANGFSHGNGYLYDNQGEVVKLLGGYKIGFTGCGFNSENYVIEGVVDYGASGLSFKPFPNLRPYETFYIKLPTSIIVFDDFLKEVGANGSFDMLGVDDMLMAAMFSVISCDVDLFFAAMILEFAKLQFEKRGNDA